MKDRDCRQESAPHLLAAFRKNSLGRARRRYEGLLDTPRDVRTQKKGSLSCLPASRKYEEVQSRLALRERQSGDEIWTLEPAAAGQIPGFCRSRLLEPLRNYLVYARSPGPGNIFCKKESTFAKAIVYFQTKFPDRPVPDRSVEVASAPGS